MTFLQTDKMKLSVLVVSFLLLVSAFTFLPAVTAYAPTTVATAGPMPASVTGATATIDSPILVGSSTPGTRTITVTNPIGNPAITSITISIPKGAVGSGTPSGTFVAGATGTVTPYGSGPWALVYASSTSGGIILPGGAAIQISVTFTTEAKPTTTGAADPYQLSAAVTDTTGASTNLNSISIYETGAAATLTLTPPTGTVTAGSNFVVSASASVTGLPLQVSATGSASSSPATAASSTTTVSPTTFTTGSGSSSITLNDTTEETLTVTVNGGTLNAADGGSAALTANTPVTISAGTLSEVTAQVTVGATTYKTGQVVNMTTYAPIAGGNILVTLADKFGNAVSASGAGTTITLTAVAINAQCSGGVAVSTCYGFSTGSVTGSYPYTPTQTSPSLITTQSITVTISTGSSITLSSNYFYGIDYGAESYITATPTSGGLAASNSATIQTVSLNTAAPTVTPTSSTPAAGKTTTLVATVSGFQQGNVPFNFANTTDYSPAKSSGSFSNGQMSINETSSIVSVSSVLTEEANATFTPSTKSGASVTIFAMYPAPSASGSFSYGTAGSSGAIITQAGSAASLVLKTYYDSLFANPSSYTNSSGGLYVQASASDAYGNSAPVSVITQVNFASSGALSVSVVQIAASASSTTTPVLAVPTSGESSYTVTATAVVNSKQVTGTTTITVVSTTPALTLSGPTTVGVDTFSGFANVSQGVSAKGLPGYVQLIQYSLNGAKNITVTTGSPTIQNLSYAFTVLLTSGKANGIIVYAEDNAGNWASQAIIVPPLPPPQTFVAPTGQTPSQYQFPNGGPKAVNSTFTNNGVSTLQIIVVMNIFTSSGIPVTPSPTATATVAAGASASTFELLNGLPSGTYSVTINVYSTTYLPLSPTYTVSVTV